MRIKELTYNSVGTIDMVLWHDAYGWLPFTASPDDAEKHGRDLYARAVAGEFGPVAPFVPPPEPTAEDRLRGARAAASLSRMEFMLSLDDAGLLDDAEALIAAPETARRIRIMWRNASRFDRLSPELLQMAQAMGVTDGLLDTIFGIEVAP